MAFSVRANFALVLIGLGIGALILVFLRQ